MTSASRSRMILVLGGLAAAVTVALLMLSSAPPVAEANIKVYDENDLSVSKAPLSTQCFTVTGTPPWTRDPQVTIRSAATQPPIVALGDPVTITVKAQNRASAVTVAVRATVNFPDGRSLEHNQGNVSIAGGYVWFQATADTVFTWTVPSNSEGTYTVDAEIMTNHDNAGDRSSCSETKRTSLASFEVVENTAPTDSRKSPSGYFVNIDAGDRQTFTVEGTDAESNLSVWEWLVGGSQERLRNVTPTGESEDSFT